jgi:AraC-like DNA-binding protein
VGLQAVGQVHRITRPPLAECIDFFWLSEGYAPAHGSEWVLPSVGMTLVVDLNARERSGAVIAGARTQSMVLDTSRPLSLIGIGFKPGGAAAFLDAPAGELQDLSVSLDAVWGGAAVDALCERLLGARSTAARFRVLEGVMVERLRSARAWAPARRRAQMPALGPTSVRHGAVTFALDAFARRAGASNAANAANAASVAEVAARVGLSPRRFIELFRNEVGLTPKVYCRLARFHQAVTAAAAAASANASPQIDWTEIALSCGYYDQPHFNHDFREFAGMSPSDYLRRRTPSPNHVRVTG